MPGSSRCQILDRSFRLSDYSEATRGLEIAKTVFVECDVDEAQVLDEALHVLRLADSPDQSHRRRRGLAVGPKKMDSKHISRKLPGIRN